MVSKEIQSTELTYLVSTVGSVLPGYGFWDYSQASLKNQSPSLELTSSRRFFIEDVQISQKIKWKWSFERCMAQLTKTL